MGTTKIQKRGPDTNQITGQMNFADLFNTDLDLQQMKKSSSIFLIQENFATIVDGSMI